MATFPTDIITEILSHLPVKILLRFKTVCKSWNSLIKSPHFIKIHLNQTLISNSTSNLHLLIYYPFLYSAEFNHLIFSTLHHPLYPNQVRLIGSCNGLISICDASKPDIYLFNPLTKSQFKLPFDKIPEFDSFVMSFGFGYDSRSDDYKVLKMFQGLKTEGVFYKEAKVFSLKNNSWKCVEGMSFYLLDIECDGVLVNEALHYAGANSQGHAIVKFDLDTESFSRLEIPDFGGTGRSTAMLSITNLGGRLCAMVNYNRDFMLEQADLWVMKEYGKKESWFKLYCLCEMERIGSRKKVKPIVYSGDRRRILLQIDTLEFGWYDLESKIVVKFTPRGLPDCIIEMSSFFGSLVSVDHKPHSTSRVLPRRAKMKNDVDIFLSSGFKLRL